MSENNKEGRLPPPAFPPGSRRRTFRNPRTLDLVKPAVESVEDAMIDPSDPLPERSDPVFDALISPDEPLPERKLELTEAFLDAHAAAQPAEGEEGVVVGMDLDPHLEPDELISGGDPHVIELMTAVAKLAESVRRRGEAGLRATPEMSRFEATLRAYCVGYLAGRRAEEPPLPEFDEALPTDG